MKRKAIALILTFTMLVVFAACSQDNSQQDATANSEESADSSASLSPGDTVVIAGMIKALIDDADTFQIITAELYPKGYNETIDAVGGPWDTAAELPELSTHVENIGDYETIVLISPIWFSTIAEPVVAFLQEYDFAGKTIVPVSSHWGGGSGKSFSGIALLCPNATVLDGLSLTGNSASSEGDTINSWLQETGLID